MNRESTLLTIRELADRSGVSIRTIRYYTTEGLLPPPEARGRYALYTDEHLVRLAFITRLKDSYLPLQSIRTQMQSVTVEQMQTLLATSGETPIVSQPDTSESVSKNTQVLEMLVSVLKAREPQTNGAVRLETQNWQRLRLREGVEVHLLLPLTEEQTRLLSFLQEAIAQA